jgi:hypothetical protein
VSLIRFLSVFDSIDRDLVAFQRKEDSMGAYPESVAIGFRLQFLHIALEIVAHQLHPMADVAGGSVFPKTSTVGVPFR